MNILGDDKQNDNLNADTNQMIAVYKLNMENAPLTKYTKSSQKMSIKL